MLDCIVMQMKKNNREKGYFTILHLSQLTYLYAYHAFTEECVNLKSCKPMKLQNPKRSHEIVELFGPLFLKLRDGKRKEAFHTITDFTLLHVLSRNCK